MVEVSVFSACSEGLMARSSLFAEGVGASPLTSSGSSEARRRDLRVAMGVLRLDLGAMVISILNNENVDDVSIVVQQGAEHKESYSRDR